MDMSTHTENIMASLFNKVADGYKFDLDFDEVVWLTGDSIVFKKGKEKDIEISLIDIQNMVAFSDGSASLFDVENYIQESVDLVQTLLE